MELDGQARGEGQPGIAWSCWLNLRSRYRTETGYQSRRARSTRTRRDRARTRSALRWTERVEQVGRMSGIALRMGRLQNKRSQSSIVAPTAAAWTRLMPSLDHSRFASTVHPLPPQITAPVNALTPRLPSHGLARCHPPVSYGWECRPRFSDSPCTQRCHHFLCSIDTRLLNVIRQITDVQRVHFLHIWLPALLLMLLDDVA